MKLIRIILIMSFVGNAFADEELPQPIQGLLFVETLRALTKNGERPPQDVIEKAVREASTLLHFNPGALKEFEALKEDESAGSTAISAVALQEAINDYELLAEGKVVPTLLSFYIARSKVEVFRPRQRVLCYIMIKSSTRQFHGKQN